MKPPLNRDELAKLVEEALEGGGYLMFRFGHGQIRQLRPDETEVVLGALRTPPEVEAIEITSKMEEAAMEVCRHDLGFGVTRSFVARVFKAMLNAREPQSSGS